MTDPARVPFAVSRVPALPGSGPGAAATARIARRGGPTVNLLPEG